ncbi:acyl-CoA dehydrogenase family protein [Mameliella alba]|uniref:Medium-chain specific acyl-CoA dehydrogenase, mitochondrial n=1 Tax=Mameliella alba TaxID=561184 RepID=A0A0B3RY75_9RHOB|nr:acyl-CoA dehydrogenase family protein [Mameliella alba]KHQ51698.1 Acyl-CoA dehydrogenase AcdA [Mameliella alba]OWV46249.1 butyryl-CoA dehydrogenase [Mameliella alba]GGF74820.1 acyl-CoA dehydrogenase [Mameliella alba]
MARDSEDPGLLGWEMPEELRALRDVVRRFMTNEVRPAEEQLPADSFQFPEQVLTELRDKARALGLWCIQSPEVHGGAGLSLLGQVVVAEEAAKCRMGAYIPAGGAFGYDPPNVIFKGNADQIARYAEPCIRNGDKTFVAISEPSGGSDPARAIRTRAVRDGDHYVLNGTKVWITGAGQSKWGVVFARTGEPGERGGITSFIVDIDTPGLTAEPIDVIRSYSPYQLTFEDCRVPVANRLGEEGQGFALAEDWLVHQRVPYSATCIGTAQAALDVALDWARDRETFGKKLADHQAIQWMLADSEVDLRAARMLVYQAAWRAERGENIKLDASVAKLFASEAANRVVDRCVQILGGMGVAKELPLERWFRETRIKRIGEGPSEVHRMVIARDLIRNGSREVD